MSKFYRKILVSIGLMLAILLSSSSIAAAAPGGSNIGARLASVEQVVQSAPGSKVDARLASVPNVQQQAKKLIILGQWSKVTNSQSWSQFSFGGTAACDRSGYTARFNQQPMWYIQNYQTAGKNCNSMRVTGYKNGAQRVLTYYGASRVTVVLELDSVISVTFFNANA
jgi:hypothetical protein